MMIGEGDGGRRGMVRGDLQCRGAGGEAGEGVK